MRSPSGRTQSGLNFDRLRVIVLKARDLSSVVLIECVDHGHTEQLRKRDRGWGLTLGLGLEGIGYRVRSGEPEQVTEQQAPTE